MRKLFAVLIATGLAILSPRASGEAPGRQRTQEVRQLRERLRELNEALRQATEEARRSPDVAAALKAVRTVQEALRKAEERANRLLDEAIIKANPDLANKVRERRGLQKKLGDRRVDRARWLGRGGAKGSPAQEKPAPKDGGPDVGQEAPDFSLQTLDGQKTVKLSDSRGKKPVVLIFASYT